MYLRWPIWGDGNPTKSNIILQYAEEALETMANRAKTRNGLMAAGLSDPLIRRSSWSADPLVR